MEGLEEQIRNTELPSIYRPLHHGCIKTISSLGFQKRLEELSPSLVEKPAMYSDGDADDEDHILRATQLLTQGRRFIEIGLRSEDEIKPLMLFYGLAQTAGCFVTSMFKYPPSGGHGIKIDRDLNVKIEDRGSFARLLDVSTLIGLRSRYSRFVLDAGKSCFVESPTTLRSKYSTAQPLQTVYDDFTGVIKMEPSPEMNVSFDHGTYLLLFIASYLARYRPEKWKRIVEGAKDETSMIIYRRVMESVPDLCQRLAVTIFLTAGGTSPNDVLERPNLSEVVKLF